MTVELDISEVHASYDGIPSPMDGLLHIKNRYRVSFFFRPVFFTQLDVMCLQTGAAGKEKVSKAFANGIHQRNAVHRLMTTPYSVLV